MSEFKQMAELAERLNNLAQACATQDCSCSLTRKCVGEAAQMLTTCVESYERLHTILAYCACLSRSVSGGDMQRHHGVTFHDGRISDMLFALSAAYGWGAEETPGAVKAEYQDLFYQIAIWYDVNMGESK